jgi:VanZ family protein
MTSTNRRRRLALSCYTSFVFAVSLYPKPSLLGSPYHIDKAYHAAAYFFLGVLAFRALSGVLGAFSMSFSVSVLIEFLQGFVPERTLDVLDAGANAAGAMAGILAWRRYRG